MIILLALFLFQLRKIDCIPNQANNKPTLRVELPVPPLITSRIPTTPQIASVKEYPKGLHICNAFFVSNDFLLTTARCVYMRQPEQLFVDLSIGVNIIKNMHEVEEIIIHPDFDVQPHIHDIALLKLKKEHLKAPIFSIPSEDHEPGHNTAILGWMFSADKTKYFAFKLEVVVPTRAICSDLLNDYMDSYTICAVANSTIEFQKDDQGSPLVEISDSHEGYALGIYNRLGPNYHFSVDKFLDLRPYQPWISSTIRQLKTSSAVETSST